MIVTLLVSAVGYLLGILSVSLMASGCYTRRGALALLAMSTFGLSMAIASVILAIICP